MRIDKGEFERRILARELGISVVGLGYVGLNIACLFARNGFSVCGFDVDEEKIRKLKRGINPVPEEAWLDPYLPELGLSTDVGSAARYGDVIFIAVPTPFKSGRTCLDHLASALASVSESLSEGKILVIESTVPPGTTEGLGRDLVEKWTGLRAGEDFGLVFSPERVDPGNTRNMIWNIPKVVGGIDSLSTEIISLLYSQVVSNVVPVSNPRTAELAKIMENTQRDVNIALTNLFAKAADRLGIDIEEALDAAATKWNFMRLKPGCGVGGECIGDAAKMLVETMDKSDVDSTLIRQAIKINESMPDFAMEKLREAAEEIGTDLRDLRIGVLGLAYKGNSCDTRNSPSLRIIERLGELGCKDIVAYDPFVNGQVDLGVPQVKSLDEALKDRDCVIIATDHNEFRNMNIIVFKENDVEAIIDGRNCLAKQKTESLGISYRGIGR